MRAIIRGAFAIVSGSCAIRPRSVAIRLGALVDVRTHWLGIGLLVATERRCIALPSAEITTLRGAVTRCPYLESRPAGLVAPP
jgi:hypothetical protein